MYLKEISASGFKSFADKLSINLDDKITCIVGPNGSGKSNVVDAVKWVLGEQSVKSLRGDGLMSDVIFSGSKSRNPLNVASVMLTFDNSDNYLKVPYTEVSVKRRVYRTGENEYFLNGEKCRLKDILDLFIDSGIGRESFNIISQGEVQKILSNASNDRRSIFEEAAGVLKYKKRKEEALRKLDRTNLNLDRVNDIVNELEEQVKPLEEQSRKAKEYLVNKENLDKYDIALMVHDIEEINYQYQRDKNQINDLNNEIISLSSSGNMNDLKETSLREEIKAKEAELSTLNFNYLNLTREVEQLNSEKKLCQEREKYNASDDKIHDNIRLLTEQNLKLATSIATLTQEINSLNNNIQAENIQNTNLKQELDSLNNQKQNLTKELDFKTLDKVNITHKLEVTRNYLENGGNISNSVKAILNNPSLLGIHDIIGNLLETDEEYTKAIEVSLASSRQFIVVDDEKGARDAINYLKNNKLGRATFFPLTVIKPKGIDYETLNLLPTLKGYIDILSNLVRYDKKYRNIILNQLGNVIVAKTLEDGNNISRQINGRYRVVTLDGDIIHVGGSMTGGSLTVSKSTITLRQEVLHLEQDQKDLDNVIRELKTNLDLITSQINNQMAKTYEQTLVITKYQETLKQKEIELASIQSDKDNIEKELSNLEHVIDNSLSSEEERILKAYYEKDKESKLVNQQIRELTSSIATLKANLDEIEAQYKLTNTNLHQKEKSLKELEINVTKLDVKLDNFLQTLSNDYNMTFEHAKENYVLDIDIDEARRKVNLYRTNIKNIGLVNLAAIDEFERVNSRYTFLNNQKNDLLNAKDTLLDIIKEMDEVMKKEFKDTFDKISSEFKQVFKELFNGGNATLKLVDPDDLLGTDIEIIASPPGKKLTTISLLSGGEKTLTAISLLFAILNVRTVPFCLFDEVEAALDEANVDNFGHYLNHYKNKTQFLIITHKKKTMEYADTLYGITMQESGVSKLVSVKLDNLD